MDRRKSEINPPVTEVIIEAAISDDLFLICRRFAIRTVRMTDMISENAADRIKLKEVTRIKQMTLNPKIR